MQLVVGWMRLVVGWMQLVVGRCIDVPHRVLCGCVRLVRGHATIGGSRGMRRRRRVDRVLGPWLTGSVRGAGNMRRPRRVSGADDAVRI